MHFEPKEIKKTNGLPVEISYKPLYALEWQGNTVDSYTIGFPMAHELSFDFLAYFSKAMQSGETGNFNIREFMELFIRKFTLSDSKNVAHKSALYHNLIDELNSVEINNIIIPTIGYLFKDLFVLTNDTSKYATVQFTANLPTSVKVKLFYPIFYSGNDQGTSFETNIVGLTMRLPKQKELSKVSHKTNDFTHMVNFMWSLVTDLETDNGVKMKVEPFMFEDSTNMPNFLFMNAAHKLLESSTEIKINQVNN